VVAVFGDNRAIGGDLMISIGTWNANVSSRTDSMLQIKAAPGVKP
jgi:hypothetical protein